MSGTLAVSECEESSDLSWQKKEVGELLQPLLSLMFLLTVSRIQLGSFLSF